MMTKNAAETRLKALIEWGIPFSPIRKRGQSLSYAESLAASTWVESVPLFVMSIDSTHGKYYQSKCRDLAAQFAVLQMNRARPKLSRVECIGEIVSVLRELLAGINSGRIA